MTTVTAYQIPLQATPQTLSVQFPNGNTYNLQTAFLFNQNPCWVMNIADANNNPLANGIPLVTGADLLEQFAYLGLGVSLYASTDGDQDIPPSWWDMGSTAHLWLVPNP